MSSEDQTPDAARDALVNIGPAAVPALEQALSNEDALTRVQAAWALADLRRPVEPLLPVLLEAAGDKNVHPWQAMRALHLICGDKPEVALPFLEKALHDDNADVADAAGAVLSNLGSAAVTRLLTALKSPNPAVRARAARALRWTGLPSPAAPALTALRAACKDEDEKVREEAKKTLEALGGEVP